MPLNIIARKPRNQEGEDFVVIDRGEPRPGTFGWQRYVSATANAHSLSHGEWFWGHYFETKDDALTHFNNR